VTERDRRAEQPRHDPNTISDDDWADLQDRAAKSNPRAFFVGDKQATAARLRDQEQRRRARRS
jgi:hypothetical protein